MPWWPGRRRGPSRGIAILVPSLYTGDAVGNDAIAMRDALAALGFDARLFAETSEPALGAGGIEAARAFIDRTNGAVILHHSTRWDIGVQLFEMARGARVLRDHNVTPESFFAGLHPEFAAASAIGVRQRVDYARDRSTALYLAASATNARELVALGADSARVRVVPPFHRIDDLMASAPDESMLRRLANAPPTALFVGRVAPNKGHRRLLRIAATYRELFHAPLHLRFVGPCDPRLGRWLQVLEADVRALGLEGSVENLGFLSLAQLKAAYLTSHLFLCCSEHEGFCVPLLEATCLGLPLIAAGSTAMADTVGEAALYMGDASDDVVACAVHRLLADAELRDQLVARERARYAERFSSAAVGTAFREAILPILENIEGVARAAG
jgi:glycosyltransferase involved in cell wall biosynthesis